MIRRAFTRQEPGQVTSIRSLPRRSVRSLRTPTTLSLGPALRLAPSTSPAAAVARRAVDALAAVLRVLGDDVDASTSAVSAPTPQLTVSASPSRAWMKSEPPVQGSAVQTLSPAKKSAPAPPSR